MVVQGGLCCESTPGIWSRKDVTGVVDYLLEMEIMDGFLVGVKHASALRGVWSYRAFGRLGILVLL